MPQESYQNIRDVMILNMICIKYYTSDVMILKKIHIINYK